MRTHRVLGHIVKSRMVVCCIVIVACYQFQWFYSLLYDFKLLRITLRYIFLRNKFRIDRSLIFWIQGVLLTAAQNNRDRFFILGTIIWAISMMNFWDLYLLIDDYTWNFEFIYSISFDDILKNQIML